VALHGVRRIAAVLLLGIAGGGTAARAAGDDLSRRVQIGDTVDDVELRTLDGRPEHFLQKGLAANVFLFFRPEQEHSTDTLLDLAKCEKEFEKKPVRWVGVVSDSWPAEQVRALVKETGVRMTVLVDVGDALYGKLGIRLHPVIGIVDKRSKLVAFEPFRAINYCDRIRVRVKYLLGEATESDVAAVDAPAPSPLPHSAHGVALRHANFARRLNEIGQPDQALAELQKSLDAAPTAAAYALRGKILAAKGKCPDALRDLDQALKLEPGNAVALEGKKRCGR
jgi:tetratricopeptide (TPR) repeat protein